MIPLLYESLNGVLGLDDLPLRVFKYTSVRAVGAFVVGFLFVFLLGRRTAAWLYRSRLRDKVRTHDEFFNRSKSGTPTMGGILVVGGIVLSGLVFCSLEPVFAPLLLLTTLWYGAVGAVDDVLKVKRRSSDGGLSRSAKILLQTGFAVVFAMVVLGESTNPFRVAGVGDFSTQLFLPFWPMQKAPLDLGILYGPFIVFVLVAIANAINFADGLDGLAIFPCALTATVYGLFAFLMCNAFTARFFGFPHTVEMQELAVYAAGVVGTCFGFLWFNGYPAQMFMGDTGSQALGGTLAALAVLCKQEMLFLLAGGIFVFEAFSVFVQDYVGIRWIGRRFFFRAPAHHSFQHQGIAETKVVLRFWIVSLLCMVLSVATLKLR